MNVLDENVGILHPYQPGTLEFSIFYIKVQLSAALGLALVGPVDCRARCSGKRDGNDGSLVESLCFPTVNHIGNLGLHL